ncbi:MAG: hypothetical protein ACI4NG_05580, partial [Candidatus Gallimonas sp.]
MRFFRTRRRRVFACLFLILAIVLTVLVPSATLCVRAEETGEGDARLRESVEELLDSLDLNELQTYLDSLSDFQGVSVREKLAGLIGGDLSADYSSLLNSVLALVWSEGEELLPAFSVILAVALLCGILNSAKSGFLHSSMSDIIHFVGYLAVGGVVLACLVTVLSAGFGAISQMKKQMELVYPILLTLMAASGGNVSAAIYRPATAFMSGAICELFASVVLPGAVVVVVLCFVGNLTEDVRTEKLGELFKSVGKWLIGLSLGLYGI